MSILNQSELLAAIAARTPSSGDGSVSAQDIRDDFTDIIDSLQSYGGVMSNGADTISATTTPTKVTTFSANNTSPNDLLEVDYTTGLIKVKEPGRYELTLRFQGVWGAVNELILEARLNGVANPITPLAVTQEGNGSDLALSWTAVTFIVNSAAIAAGPGGAYAEVELFASAQTGSFSVTQNTITFGLAYGPLSIRTVG
jgi:hypothetical protein